MFEELLIRLASSLDRNNIPYMITGGQAVLLYGEPRLTRDIDLTIGVNQDCLEKILQIAQEIHLTILPKEVASFVRDTMVLPLIEDKTGIRVDIVFSFTPYEVLAISRANKIKIKSQVVCFASVEDVMIHKIFAGRPRDIEDVRVMIKKNERVDLEYLKRWLNEFDQTFKGKNFLQTFLKIQS